MKTTNGKYVWIGLLVVMTVVILSLFQAKLISYGLLYSLSSFYFLLCGIYIIIKHEGLSKNQRIIWLVFVIFLNVIAVICFLFFNKIKKK